jgi:hypothetical protein
LSRSNFLPTGKKDGIAAMTCCIAHLAYIITATILCEKK